MTAARMRAIGFMTTLLPMLWVAGQTWAESGKIVKWVDEKGVTHYGDVVPPQYSGRDSTVINRQGIVIKRNLINTPQADPAEAQQSAEQQRRDRALKAAYTTEDEIDLAKERNLQMDEASMLGLQQSLSSAKNRQLMLKKSVDDLAKRKKPQPDDLKKDVKDNEAEIAKIEGQIAQRRKAMDATRQRFDTDKQRFRELTQKEAAPEPIKVAPSPAAAR
ncbi:MAG TPA: DUF4124 domain-containing protein [Methylophilaceae bacterium]|nr:DUF4124 domain-containing protein [Methylophilaceae bacterium]